MIIIEGPDSSGKSVLSKKLSRDLCGIMVHHFGGPPLDHHETLNRAWRSVSLLTQRTIQDRTPLISEPVYGRIMRTPRKEFLTWEKTFPVVQAMRPVIIYCRPGDEKLAFSQHDREAHDTPKYLAQLKKMNSDIIDRYDNLMNILRPTRYDYTEDASGDWYKSILEICSLRLEHA